MRRRLLVFAALVLAFVVLASLAIAGVLVRRLAAGILRPPERTWDEAGTTARRLGPEAGIG